MGVFATDKRLVTVFSQKFFYGSHRCVHLTFYIARFVVAAIVKDALIMNKARIVKLTEQVGHLFDDKAAEGFVSAGPDKDGRMVFVALIGGIHPI